MREPTGTCATIVSMSTWKKVGKAWTKPGEFEDAYRFWVRRNSSNRYESIVEYLDGRVHPKWLVLGRHTTVRAAKDLVDRLDSE